MNRFGIDVGGSGIKGGIVDSAVGELVGERHRIDTPESFAFDEVVAAILDVASAFSWDGPMGVGFPAVVRRGEVLSPPTAHEFEGWVGRDLADTLTEKHGAPVLVGNDADVAGVAEMQFGAGAGQEGVVIVLTLGTGVGSAMFVDGRLIPNTELGKLYLRHDEQVAENRVASRVRKEEQLSYEAWGRRVDEYLDHVDRLFTPDLIVLGGGVSRKADKFLSYIDVRCPVIPAQLRNHAGIVGASALTTGP